MGNKKVGIVMGSKSDLPVMEKAAYMLRQFGIECEMTIASAHRSPRLVREYATSALDRGISVIIAGAGAAAHLPGVLASGTTLPVIGVPIASSPLGGFDSLLAMVQMPSGIPVATMAVGPAGATNAGIMAAQILAMNDPELALMLRRHRQQMAEEIEGQARQVLHPQGADGKQDEKE
ncbi:MAG: 5-(carboxyamino)imidazole ribonucleotide mutase [Deltaproteobacteria bacterium]|nr:5-(carboxyamino)imidazole ribonucleotide mutase [Deltaproteobacteria bacterium]MBW2305476.1 5-(carboxyamino)imidazole ribonucleotide mutase [Deltaproteobacteria bacterium]